MTIDQLKTEENRPQPESQELIKGGVDGARESLETSDEFIKRAQQEVDESIAQLHATGSEIVGRSAEGAGESLDEQVREELAGLEFEAVAARSEFERSIKEIQSFGEKNDEDDHAKELGAIGEELSSYLSEAGILQPNGLFVENAKDIFEAVTPKDQQTMLELQEKIEALSKTLGDSLFSTDALRTVPMEIREELIRGAAMRFARENPEGYVSALLIATEHQLIPALSEDKVQAEKKYAVWVFISHKQKQIESQFTDDPLEAVKAYRNALERAQGLGLDSLDISFDFKEEIKAGYKKIESEGGDTVEYFRGLPDGAPGLVDVALFLTDKHMSGGMNQKTRKEEGMRLLGETAPDAILQYANHENHFTQNAWSQDEIADLARRVIRLPDAKRSILANTAIPIGVDQETTDAFEKAYREFSTRNLLVNADRFPHATFDERLARKAIQEGATQELFYQLDLFKDLTRDLAEKLIDYGKASKVLEHQDKFSGLARDVSLAIKLIEKAPQVFIETIDSFPDAEAVVDELVARDPVLALKNLEKIISSEQLITAVNSPQVALTQRLDIIKRETNISEKVAWGNALIALEKVQARSARAEHDPWITDLDPLVRSAIDQGILSPRSPEDGALLVSFVQEFGAVRAIRTFEIFSTLKRITSVDALSESMKQELQSVFGQENFESMRTPEAVIKALRHYCRELTGSLLRDEIPNGMETGIGKELLMSIKGTTQWEKNSDLGALIDTWKKTVEKNPDLAKIPEGYQEVNLIVRTRKRVEGGAEVSVEGHRVDVVANLDTQIRFKTFQEGFRMGSRSVTEILAEAQEQIQSDLRGQTIKAESRIATVPERGRVGIKENIDALNKQMEQIVAIGFELPTGEKPTDAQIIDLMKQVLVLKNGKPDEGLRAMKNGKLDELLRTLSVAHIREVAPTPFVETMEKLRSVGDATAEDLIASRDFMVDYLGEHYLNPEQQQHQTGHESFPPDVVKALKQVWQITSGIEEHPLVRAGNELRQLDTGVITEDTIDISLIPVQGMLRIFSGDIGDACYTSKHDELAKGEVPDLHAMIFVTGRGTSNERLAGSVLFVETESDDGRKTLMVRANNPRENLLQNVDSGELIGQTLGEAIAIAKKRGIDRVVVPRDGSSKSSSNRPSVSRFYQENFPDAPRIGLKNEPETTFNGYNNWDKTGPNAVVEVWVS